MNKLESILDYLRTREPQDPPSVGLIADAIGMSVESTHHMLTVLCDKGYIAWEPEKRAIRLLRLS